MIVLPQARDEGRSGISAALAGSLALHLGITAIAIFGLPLSRPLEIGPSVPVNLVAVGPANLRPALEAPREMEATTPEPAPQARPEPVAPPAPAPPAPAPAPRATPQTAAPKAAARSARPAEAGLDLQALASQLAAARAASGRRAARAPVGPAAAATSVEARPAVGAATGMTASALSALATELRDRWSPNCEVEGGADVDVAVAIAIGAGGRLSGQPRSSTANSADPIVKAASDRAIRAVNQAAPFSTLPSELFGQSFTINFNARKACALG